MITTKFATEATVINGVRFFNCTPHPLHIENQNGIVFTIPPFSNDGINPAVVRAAMKNEPQEPLAGFQLVKNEYGSPIFPEGKILGKLARGNVVIVSALALQAIAALPSNPIEGILWVRPGEPIRNEEGVIIGAEGFATL
jgi:hypothetical protein